MKFKKIAAVLLAGAILSSAALGGCGNINQDAVVATYNQDTQVSLGFANFVAHYTQATYDQLLAGTYGEEYWQSTTMTQDGTTMEDSVKTSVMETIETYYLLEAHMADYNIEISEDETAAMKEAAAQFMEDNDKDAIRQMGATEEYVEKMLYYRTVQQKMEAAIKAEADTNVSEEEAAQSTFSYMQIDLKGYTDDEGTYQEYTEEQVASAKEKAEAAAAVAKKDFDAAAETNDYTIQQYSFGSDEESEEDGGFNDAVIKAVKKMKDGDVSGLIEGTDCYYLVRLDSKDDKDAAETKKAEIITERENARYTEVTDGYKEEAKFEIDEKEWEKVKFEDLFTAVQTESESEDTDTTQD